MIQIYFIKSVFAKFKFAVTSCQQEKTVQIEETHNMYGEDHGRRHNLNMYQFCYKNEKFDLEKVRTHNIEESGTFEFVSKALLVLEIWFVKGWVYTYKP